MTWSKFDDRYDENEHVEDAWFEYPPNPVGLHVMATTACNRWLSDGLVRARWIASMLDHHPLMRTKDVAPFLDAMVAHELFDRIKVGDTLTVHDSDGETVVFGPYADVQYVVHNFLLHHDSKRQVKARRSADAERKRAGRRKAGAGTTSGAAS